MPTQEQVRRARRLLDERLAGFRPAGRWAPPRAGWVRAIRDALGMPASDLARRMGISQPGVFALEQTERNGSTRLDSLRRAAEAMDCTLVYAFIPNEGLEETVRRQAERLADEQLGRVQQTMALEDQAAPVSADAREELVQRLAGTRGLWSRR